MKNREDTAFYRSRNAFKMNGKEIHENVSSFFVKWSDYKKIKEYLKNYDKEKIEEYVEVSQNEFEM